MGVSVYAKRKANRSIDMPYSGFDRLRQKISSLYGGPWVNHYAQLLTANLNDAA